MKYSILVAFVILVITSCRDDVAGLDVAKPARDAHQTPDSNVGRDTEQHDAGSGFDAQCSADTGDGDRSTVDRTTADAVSNDSSGDMAPEITLNSPSDGETIHGAVAVRGRATDDVALTKAELYIDNNHWADQILGGTADNFEFTVATEGATNGAPPDPPTPDWPNPDPDDSPPAIEFEQVAGSFGGLGLYIHVPSNMPDNAPLVVALHGCNQTAASYKDGTEWNTLADRYKFYVAYANKNGGCMAWFGSPDRSSSEVVGIVDMVQYMKDNYSIDDNRVYATGLSAGGYMSVVMCATYPEVFSGAGVSAGGPYTGNVTSAGPAGFSGPYPKITAFHGTLDGVVAPSNLADLAQQWIAVHGVSGTAAEEDFRGATHKVYSKNGQPVVETYLIPGLGHSTAIDPGSDPDQGGQDSANYTEDADVYSPYYMAKFFGLTTETPILNIAITEPSDGDAQLTGHVDIRVSVVGDAINRVVFFVDNTEVASDDSAPYHFRWDTNGVSEGQHLLRAVVYNDAGQSAQDQIAVSLGEGERRLSAGPHSLRVVVHDSAGNSAESVVNITVSNCREVTATNFSHVAEGRAETYNSNLYARTIGAGDELGTYGSVYYSPTTTIRQTAPDHWELGTCQ